MASYSKENEKEYLDLLYDYQSDETKKTRRNLTVASFVVVALHLIGKKLSDTRFFWTDLEGSDQRWLLGIAAAVLVYWVAMGILYALRDKQLHNERKRLLDAHIKDLMDTIDRWTKKIETNVTPGAGVPGHMQTQLQNATTEYAPYLNQLKRTVWARRFGIATKAAEIGLPIVFATWALVYIVCDFLSVS